MLNLPIVTNVLCDLSFMNNNFLKNIFSLSEKKSSTVNNQTNCKSKIIMDRDQIIDSTNLKKKWL